MNFYAFHIGDYAAHTAHLEPMEDLAYRRCLDLYYTREAALPADPADVARLVRLRGEPEAVRLVLVEFFELTEAGWKHKRCDVEIAEAQEKRAKAQASANKRWGSNANAMPTHSDRMQDAVPSECEPNAPNPTPNPTPKKKDAPAALTLDDLEAEGVSREAAAEWIAVRKRKRGGPVTPLAWSGFKSEAAKAGWTLEAAVRKCVQRVWVSFEAAWVANEKSGETPYQRSQREKYEQVTPAIAAKSPGVVGPTNVMEILDARVVAQIGR